MNTPSADLAKELAAGLPCQLAGEPDWIAEMRRRSEQDFRRFGLPDRKVEAWKYTGLGAMAQSRIKLGAAGVAQNHVFNASTRFFETDYHVELVNAGVASCDGSLVDGVSVSTLNEALGNGLAGLRQLLESLHETAPVNSSSGFTSLNTATISEGLVIHVAKGVDAGSIMMRWSSVMDETPKLFNARVCIILDDGAKLELIEQFENESGNANATNIVVQCDLGHNAELQHSRVQQESDQSALITRTLVNQQSESEYAYFGFDLGGGLVRHEVHSQLNGENANVGINGAYILDGNRHVDNHTRVDHIAQKGTSKQYFRGVAGGSGRAVFNTAVCVHPGADGADAMQSNANILLSPRAEIDTKPELEIYADEVVASHGATVGKLDDQAVFYLRSRGLNEQDARQMLIAAFCRSVCDRMSNRKLADAVSSRLTDALPREI